MKNNARNLPSIDKIINSPEIKNISNLYQRDLIRNICREVIDEERKKALEGLQILDTSEIIMEIINRLSETDKLSLQPIINATGVLIHTNVGRSPLSKDAATAMFEISSHYNSLEFDLETGERGHRDYHIEKILKKLIGVEASTVVCNNAASMILILSSLGYGKEVIISRGELIEIGGGFRIPDIMKLSGATLIEVGTTNKTYINDYESQINEKTALILCLHQSNFKIIGFTHSPSFEDLVKLGGKYNIPVIYDLGSGALFDPKTFGITDEPYVQDLIKKGFDIVCFSGDKLIGGPQCGIIIGKEKLIKIIRKHPFARALRVDKSILAGLEVTLRHYLKGEHFQKIPVLQMINTSQNDIEKRVILWQKLLNKDGIITEVIDTFSTIGGGTTPSQKLPSKGLSLDPKQDIFMNNFDCHLITKKLRNFKVPVITRIEQEKVIFDARTVFPDEDEILLSAIKSLKD